MACVIVHETSPLYDPCSTGGMRGKRERGGFGLTAGAHVPRQKQLSPVRTYRAHGKRHAVQTSGKAKVGRATAAKAAKGARGAGAARVHPGPSLAVPAVSPGVGHVQLFKGRKVRYKIQG